MNTNWIVDVLRLNSRIVTTQAMVSAQGDRILMMLEAQQDISAAEDLFMSYGQRLLQLRRMQAALLQEPAAKA